MGSAHVVVVVVMMGMVVVMMVVVVMVIEELSKLGPLICRLLGASRVVRFYRSDGVRN
jgi:hypothetical protein